MNKTTSIRLVTVAAMAVLGYYGYTCACAPVESCPDGCSCQPTPAAPVAPVKPVTPRPAPKPVPNADPSPVTPSPRPQPHPCPGPGPCPRPWGPQDAVRSYGTAELSEGGPVGPGGVEVSCDLPPELRTHNVGGRDGAGLCLAPDTPVVTRKGVVEIAKLDPKTDAVLYRAANGSLSYTRNYVTKKTGVEKRLTTLAFEGGRTLTLTPAHRVATKPTRNEPGRAADGVDYREAGDLRVGDVVYVAGVTSYRTGPLGRPRSAQLSLSTAKVLSASTADVAPTTVWDLQNNESCHDGEGNFFADGVQVHNCVFTSIMHSARFQNERRLWNFQTDMRKEPGGGYPSKVDAMIARYGAGTPYVQHEGADLEFLYAAVHTGRMPAVTYDGFDMHYRGPISHMVNLVYLGAPDANPRMAAILDNNFVGPNQLVWMTAAEFKQRWVGRGGGWAVVLLAPPPPPVPHNNTPSPKGVEAVTGGEAKASILVNVPEDAVVTINGAPTTQTGAWRRYITPPLPAGREFCYDVGVTSSGNTVVRRVTVRAGEESFAQVTLDGDQLCFGVEPDPTHGRTNIPFRLNGREVSRTEVMRALVGGNGQLVDDSALLRLTLVGPEAQKRKGDLGTPSLGFWKDHVLVQDYDSADAPMLKGLGFTAGAYLQLPDGAVLMHSAPGSAQELAQALRKSDPHYDPAKDPDPLKPVPPPPPPPVPPEPPPAPAPHYDLSKVPVWAWVVGGVLVLLLLVRKVEPK
jgi:uncharacterized protein (TIGR03000 family)